MFRGHHGSTPHSAAKARNRKLFAAGIPILCGIVLVCLIVLFSLKKSQVKLPEPPGPEPAAELVSAAGMVLLQHPGKAEWQQVKTGAHLQEGDLVRTESSGSAEIRYKSGSTVTIPGQTVFTVQGTAGNVMEIAAPPEEASLNPRLIAGEIGNSIKGAQTAGSKPSVELRQIVPFGRSLELIGRVEAGSRLVINNDIVEVSGDGSFKHFTSAFPLSARLVYLNLKVTDLAGRTRTWTATHDFSAHGGEN